MNADPINLYDPFGLLTAEPGIYVQAPSLCWETDGGEGRRFVTCLGGIQTQSQGATQTGRFIRVANPSKTGPRETRIKAVLDWIKENIDPECSAWLAEVKDAIAALEGDDSDLDTVAIGHGTFNNTTVAAFTGNNPNQTDLPPGYAITINDAGAFFVGTYTNASGQQSQLSVSGYAGGTSQAQVMILLHELAHFLSAEGFQPDFNDSRAGNQNNQLIKDKCKKTLDAAKKLP